MTTPYAGQPSIFISYRWGDTTSARLLWRELVDRFGEDEVFLDREDLHSGDDFPDELVKTIEGTEVFLAVMGPDWVSEPQLQRLHDERDFVRKEIKQALCRREEGGLLLIPVWMGNSVMPKLAGLPSCLDKLHTILVDMPVWGSDYRAHLDDLLKRIEAHCGGLLGRRSHAWMLETLRSPELSTARYGQNLAVLDADSGHRVIRRSTALSVLDDWWRDWPQHLQPFILLGEEGDGKSWAVASWLAGKAAAVGFTTPLLYMPAIHTDSPRLGDLISKGFAGPAPGLNLDRWEKTLSVTSGDRPALLIVIDALNERSSLEWLYLFDRTPPWFDQVAVIAVCRTAYWDKLAARLETPVATWRLDRFDDRELDAALAAHGMQRSHFQPDVLALMAKPRYFDMASRLHGRIEAGGITVERLIYESWRTIYEHKRGDQKRLAHEDFLVLIRELAEKWQTRVRTSEFSGLLPPGPWQAGEVLDELTSARIMTDKDGKLVLESDHLALGLGLLLAEAVEEACEQKPDSLDAVIAQHTAGQAAMDIEVRIRGMALFHAMRREDYPDKGRVALLRAWVESRNTAPEDLRHAADYLPLRPKAYLEMATYLWGESNNREVQDAFMAGFLEYGHLDHVHRELIPAFTEWLGLVHLDGYRATFEHDRAKLAEEHRQVADKLGGEIAVGATVDLFGYRLTATRNPGLMRLGQMAVAVISHFDKRPYAQALATGLLAKAIMGGSSVEFNWLCRSASPEAVAALMQSGQAFLSAAHPTATLAARHIFSALGTAESLILWSEIPTEFRPPNPLKQLYDEHPCDSHLWRWREDTYQTCLCLQHLHPSFVAKQLKELALNPVLTMPEQAMARLSQVGEEIDLSQIGRYRGTTPEQHLFEEIEPALCAFAPKRYADLIQSLAQEMVGRSGESRHMLAWLLYEHLPILDDASRGVLETAWEAALQSSAEEDKWAEHVLYPMALFDRSTQKQFQSVQKRAYVDGYLSRYEPHFRPLTLGDYPAVESALATLKAGESERRLHTLLWYLAHTLTSLTDTLRPHLLRYFELGDPATRGFCLEIYVRSQDQIMAEAVIQSGWHYKGEGPFWLENVWGSLLLCHFAGNLPYLELASRIAPEWWGYAVAQRGNRPEDLAVYARLLDQTWQHIARLSDELDTSGPRLNVTVDRNEDILVDAVSVVFPNSTRLYMANYTWGGSAGMASLDQFEQATSPELQAQAHNLAYRRVIDQIKAEHSAGNPWFADSFHYGQLDRVVALGGAPWRKWVAPVLSGGQEGRKVLSLCRGFYEKLCAALLGFAPAEGEKLFRILQATPGVLLTDAASGLPILKLDLFASCNSIPVNLLRKEILDDGASDHDLFEVALLAQLGKQDDWLREEMENRLASASNFEKARALVLQGFSSTPEDGERLAEFTAYQPDSWVRNVAETALQYHQRDAWARHWFTRFIEEADRVHAWAAFRLFLGCVDRRYLVWLPIQNLKSADNWKVDAYGANLETIKKAATNNEKARVDVFLGEKTKPRQLWPWMADYHSGRLP